MKIVRRAFLPVALLGLLLTACGRDMVQPTDGSDNAEYESRTVNDDAANDSDSTEEKEIPVNDGGIVAIGDGLTFPRGNAVPGGFTGTAYLAPMINEDEVYHFPRTNHITFEPGARSGWHSHGGMVILVTGGVGYYQEEGGTMDPRE